VGIVYYESIFSLASVRPWVCCFPSAADKSRPSGGR